MVVMTASRYFSMIAIMLFLLANPSLAAKYSCGVFLDDNDDPSATAKFDSSSGQRTIMQAGDFVGFVQVNGQKFERQTSGIQSGLVNPPTLLIGNAGRDNTVSVAAYPDAAEMMLGLLQLSTGKQAITTCVLDGKELMRPSGL